MITIPKNKWSTQMVGGRVKTLRVFVECPGCHTVAPLNHDVADDGTVSPSLDCPFDDCSFHDHVKLEGWKCSDS